jgi:hypothetical protein
MKESDRFELQAFRAFPDNRRAKDLYFRSLTGAEMSFAEKSELRDIWALINKKLVTE